MAEGKKAWTAIEMGKKGGKSRAKKLTPEQRQSIARLGGLAGKGKKKPRKKKILDNK